MRKISTALAVASLAIAAAPAMASAAIRPVSGGAKVNIVTQMAMDNDFYPLPSNSQARRCFTVETDGNWAFVEEHYNAPIRGCSFNAEYRDGPGPWQPDSQVLKLEHIAGTNQSGWFVKVQFDEAPASYLRSHGVPAALVNFIER